MPVCGDLTTMSLVELLRWASAGRKTGVLEVEQNQICRRIEFRKGWIGACATEDPPARLGHLLLSRGRIDVEKLRSALERREATGQSLGVVLMQMGVLTQIELARHVAEKAEETVQGLFDWEEAVFRYHEGATLEPDQIEVNLSVEEIVRRGLEHQDELRRIRLDFPCSGVVLRRVVRSGPAEHVDNEVAQRILDAIDGERTIAEVLLHAHASAFRVIKFLHRLFNTGHVVIAARRPANYAAPTLLDVPPRGRPAEGGEWVARDLEAFVGTDLPHRAVSAPAPVGALRLDRVPDWRHHELDAEVEVATRLMSRGEHAAALELLGASYRAYPGESYLRRLIYRAEAGYVERVRAEDLSSDRVPIAVAETIAAHELLADESFLLSLIDGETDIRSILWLSPMREVDVLRALERMSQHGLIRFEPTREAETGAAAVIPTSPDA